MIASLVVLLYLAGIISQSSAVTSLYIVGIILIIAELGIVSLGMIAVNGLIALYAGYMIQSGNDMIFGLSVSWPVLFAIAFIETMTIVTVFIIHKRLQKIKAASGTENMIGNKATVIEWNGKNGNVRYDGEIWKAVCEEEEITLYPNDQVTVQSINKLELTITK